MSTHSLPSFACDIEDWIIDKVAGGYSNRQIAESLIEYQPDLLPEGMTAERFVELVSHRLRNAKHRGIWDNEIEERRLKGIRRPITLSGVQFIECANREERLLIIQDQLDALRRTQPSKDFKAKDMSAEIRAYLTLADRELTSIKEESIGKSLDKPEVPTGSPNRENDSGQSYLHLLGGKTNGGVPPMRRMDQEARAREGEEDYE